MPFIIHTEIMKRYGDMPLIAGGIWQKSSFALLEKCRSYTQRKNETFLRYAPYRSRVMWQKMICSPKNALYYTQRKNETLLRYAPYRNRHMYQKSTSSPRKMPFTIHGVTMNRFEDMPLIEDAIWGKG